MGCTPAFYGRFMSSTDRSFTFVPVGPEAIISNGSPSTSDRTMENTRAGAQSWANLPPLTAENRLRRVLISVISAPQANNCLVISPPVPPAGSMASQTAPIRRRTGGKAPCHFHADPTLPQWRPGWLGRSFRRAQDALPPKWSGDRSVPGRDRIW